MPPIPIASSALLKSIARYEHKKFRHQDRKFLLEGVHLVREGLGEALKPELIVVTEQFAASAEGAQLLAEAAQAGVNAVQTSLREIRKLSDAMTPQGVLAVAPAKQLTEIDFWREIGDATAPAGLLVALEEIADPGNLGTILRTCDWFGVNGVVLDEHSVELHNPKVVRSTMGAIFHLPVFEGASLELVVAKAKVRGFKIVTTVVKGGGDLRKAKFPEKSLVIFGNESRGLSPTLASIADMNISIPSFGKAESLNVAAACAVVLGRMRLG